MSASTAASVLDAGFDDVLRLPMEVVELVARLRVLSGRGPGRLSGRVLAVGATEVVLTAHEARLCTALLERPGEVVETSALARAVYGRHIAGAEHRLKQLAYTLRKKLPTSAQLEGSPAGIGGVPDFAPLPLCPFAPPPLRDNPALPRCQPRSSA